MRYYLGFLTCFLSSSLLWASVGKVVQLPENSEALIMRQKSKLQASPQMKLQSRDDIFSHDTELVLQLASGSRITLAKNSQIKVIDQDTIDFIQGAIFIENSTPQKVQADGVAFTSEKAAFEVSLTSNKDIDLDVVSGEVEVSSPYVHTFVPEMVKGREGFRFTSSRPGYHRREFQSKFKTLAN